MTTQPIEPPLAQPGATMPCCPEAQADGVPCEDSSSQCGSCAHLVEAMTGVSRPERGPFTAEAAARAEKR